MGKIEWHHIYTSKRYVLLEISEKLKYDCNNNFSRLDILVFKNPKNGFAEKPSTYQELEELLKDYDKVYDFNRVETQLHGAIGYDIILDGDDEMEGDE